MSPHVKQPVAHRAVRIAAYRRAVRLQAGGVQKLQQLVAAYVRKRGRELEHANYWTILDHFNAFERVGGDALDLLAATHNGVGLDTLLALPWPPPRYVKSRKEWRDDPLDLRQLRAEPRKRRAKALRAPALPRLKRDAYRKCKAKLIEINAHAPAVAPSFRKEPPAEWERREFRRFKIIGGEPAAVMWAIKRGMPLADYLAAPTAAVPDRWLRDKR